MPNQDFVAVAEYLYAARRRRDHLPGSDMFGEPAWDALLFVFISQGRERLVSITDVVAGAAAPPTTGLRWLGVLESRKLIIREDDPADRRRSYVKLTPKGFDWMHRFLRLTD